MFIGYVIGGPPGADVATLGIFAPAFFFVGMNSLILPRIRRSPVAASMLDGVVVGSLAGADGVATRARRDRHIPTLLIAAISIVLLLRYRINAAWLIAGAGVLGWLAMR
jgi:chromate transporter